MPSETKLTTTDGNEITLDDDRILANDVTFPWEYNPHNVRLWIVCNEYGAMGAVWAGNEQDALDELVDADLAHGILVDDDSADPEFEDEYARLGNAGERADLSNCRLDVVRLDEKQDARILCRFAEARGAGKDNLWQ